MFVVGLAVYVELWHPLYFGVLFSGENLDPCVSVTVTTMFLNVATLGYHFESTYHNMHARFYCVGLRPRGAR